MSLALQEGRKEDILFMQKQYRYPKNPLLLLAFKGAEFYVTTLSLSSSFFSTCALFLKL